MTRRTTVWREAARAALQRWLTDHDMSQSELARFWGITQATISRWINGKQPVPTWAAYALRGLEPLLKRARDSARGQEISRDELNRLNWLTSKIMPKLSMGEWSESSRVERMLDVLDYDIYELLNIERPEDESAGK